MNEIFLLAIITYVVIIVFGQLSTKYLHIPWMFTVVVFSIVLSSLGLFRTAFQSEIFYYLSKMGMLFFLFSIGVDLDLEKIRSMGKYIVIGDLLLTLTEGSLLGLLFYFVFPDFVSHSIIIALLSGIAFGTVGEVILLAILKEFGLESTRFGQLALGIGVFDDLFEMLVLAVIIALPEFAIKGGVLSGWMSMAKVFFVLFCVLFATFVLSKAGKHLKTFFEKIGENSFVIPSLFFLVILSFFYFSSINFENMSVIAAIFSGIAVQQLFPAKQVTQYKKQIYFIGSLFLGPFFFLSLGSKISFTSLLSNPLLILAIILISLVVRVTLSYFLFRRIIGKKQSAVLGVGLCSKFSTSVVSENILFSTGLIAAPLYSAIMASFILMKPIIMGIFSRYLSLIKDQIE